MKTTLKFFFVAILLMESVYCIEDEEVVDESDNEVFNGQGKIFNVYSKLKAIPPQDTMENIPLNADDLVKVAHLPPFPVLSDIQRDPEVQQKTLKANLDEIERQYDEMSFGRNDKRINPEESFIDDQEASPKTTRSRNSKFLGFPNTEQTQN